MLNDNELPEDYTPTCMRETKDPLRKLGFGIGKLDVYGGFGMSYGVVPTLKEMLEIPGDDDYYIIRFNPDETDDKLYQWKEDRWVKQL